MVSKVKVLSDIRAVAEATKGLEFHIQGQNIVDNDGKTIFKTTKPSNLKVIGDYVSYFENKQRSTIILEQTGKVVKVLDQMAILLQTDNNIILRDNNNKTSKAISLSEFSVVWEVPSYFKQVFLATDILLCFHGRNKSQLFAYNKFTGRELWSLNAVDYFKKEEGEILNIIAEIGNELWIRLSDSIVVIELETFALIDRIYFQDLDFKGNFERYVIDHINGKCYFPLWENLSTLDFSSRTFTVRDFSFVFDPLEFKSTISPKIYKENLILGDESNDLIVGLNLVTETLEWSTFLNSTNELSGVKNSRTKRLFTGGDEFLKILDNHNHLHYFI